jgi:phospholipase D1/2
MARLSYFPSMSATANARKSTGRKSAGKRPAWGKLIAFLVVCIALAAAWRFTPLKEWITASQITEWSRMVREFRWAPVIVIAAYVPTAFLMFPRPLLTLMTVVAFGPWLGFTYGMVGILVSALATYYAGRVLKRETVERLAGDSYERVKKGLRRHGLIAMTVLRLVPAAPFAVEGILAGTMRIKMWHFLVGTALGVLPGVLAASFFGHQITAALDDPSKINWWIVGAVILMFAGLMWAAKRWVMPKH